MKKIVLCLLMALATMNWLAAQNHFVFIQSENRQPFSVSLNNSNYNSTGAGYVILPKLASGEYDITVTFPKQTYPASRFNFIIDKKDVGFSIKAGNELALTNIQTFITVRPGEKALYVAANKGAYGATAKADNKDVNTKEPATYAESPSLKLHKGINKVFEVQGAQEVSLRFVDVQDKGTDTIDIVIPVSNSKKVRNDSRAQVTGKDNKLTFLPIEARSVESGLSLMEVKQQGYNVNCVNLADGEDFYKLRKKMASESNDEKMINEAKKAARNKCYTTVQIKNLSSLFLSDEGKYKFFKAMYPLVYDYIQFSSLEKELTDNSTIEKFRTILTK